jgi:hypothetical protein
MVEIISGAKHFREVNRGFAGPALTSQGLLLIVMLPFGDY